MANTAELTIVLKADGSGLTGTVRVSADEVRKLGQALDDTGKKASDASRKLDDSGKAAEKMGTVIGAAAAAAAAGFALLVKQQIDYAAGLVTTASRTGFAVEQLSALNAAARRNDASNAAMTAGIDALGESIVRAAAKAGAGGRQTSAAFTAIGVSVRDARGHLRPTVDVLQDVARGLASVQDPALKSELATKLLGNSGKELLGTLDELASNGLQGVIDKAGETGEVITAQAAAAAKKFNDDVQALQSRVGAFAQGVAQDLLPTLTSLAEVLLDTGNEADKTGNRTSTLRSFVEGLGLAVVVATETFRVLFTMLYGGIDIVLGVGEAAVRTLQSMGLAAAAVAAFQSGNLQLAGEFAAKSKDTFSAGWDAIREHATRAFEGITAAGDEADKKIAAYKQHLAQGYNDFRNVVAGTGDETGLHVAPPREVDASSNALQRYIDALKRTGNEEEKAAARLRAQRQAMATLQEHVNTLAGSVAGPAAQAWAAYTNELIKLSQEGGRAIEKGASLAAVQEMVASGVRAAAAAYELKTRQIREELDITGKMNRAATEEARLVGLSKTARAQEAAVIKAENEARAQWLAGKRQQVELTNEERDAARAAGAELERVAEVEEFLSQFGDVDPFTKLREGIKLVGEEIDKATDPAKVERLQLALGNMRHAMVEGIVQSSQDGLRSIQALTTDGSKAFKALQIAIDALTVVQAISAVLNQGQGDPYTAFARMAAMAAAVIALGVDIANFSGGGGPSNQSAEYRQAHQGTGTVLGDAEAKSESIARATEITANATEQLVGINRGMLDALRSLQRALGAAGNQLARGAGEAEFPGLHNTTYGLLGPIGKLDPLLNAMTGGNDPIGNAIGSFLWGGKQKVIDEGIQIAGGTLGDMLNQIVVGAYQTVHTSGGLFGSGSTKDQFGAVSDEFSKQFQLVIQSIADTVREGAKALGVLPADVEAAIASYQVEATKISLKGLSAEDQQKALEAVFSKIFDGLAGAVVPFVAEFQQVGEGLGETLVRIATEVQVTQEAFKQLGLAVNETDPQKFAEIADGLVEAAGGIDSFISGMQSFVANFSSDAHQFSVDAEALRSAFAQVGLTVPQTREGLFDLMQTLDATTAQGREQIATLLRLADTANAYYDQLDDINNTLGLNQTSEFRRQLFAIRDSALALVQALRNAGASTETLQHVYDASVTKINQLVAQLEASAQSDAFDLGLTTIGSLDEVNAEIERLKGLADQSSSSVHGFGDAMQEAAQRATDAIQLLLGDKSPLNDQQKLQTALGGLQAGTVTQEQVLEIGRRLYASSQAYNDLFALVQRIGDHTRASNAGGGGGGRSDREAFTEADRVRLADLLKEQQQLQAAAQLERFQNLAREIAEVASVKEEDFHQTLARMGVQAEDLARGLGLASDEQLTTYIEGIQAQTDSAAESADRIIAALYDIAGLPVPAGQQVGTEGHYPGHDVPLADNSASEAAAPFRPFVRPSGDESAIGGRPAGAVAPPPPPSSGGAATSTPAAAASDAVVGELRAVRELLNQVIAVTRQGSTEVVAAVGATTDSIDGLEATIRRPDQGAWR